MVITSSSVYQLISERFSILLLSESQVNIPLTSVKLLKGQKVDPGCLYISDTYEEIRPHLSQQSAFILISPAGSTLEINAANGNIAEIETNMDKLDVLYAVFDIFQKLKDWDIRLKEVCSDGIPDLFSIFAIGHEIFKRPFCLIDRNYTYVAYTPDYSDIKTFSADADEYKVPFEIINELLLDEEYIQSLKEAKPFFYPNAPSEHNHFCIDIFKDNQYLARVLAELTTPDIGPGEIFLFKHLVKYIDVSFAQYADDIFIKRQNDSKHNLFKCLIFHPEETSMHETYNILKAYNWDVHDQYSVTVFQSIEQGNFELVSHHLCQQLEHTWPHSCALKTDGEVIWIVNNTITLSSARNGNGFYHSLAYIIRDLACKAGISNTMSDIIQIPYYKKQSDIAFAIGKSKDPHFWYYKFSDYTLDYMINQCTSNFSIDQLCHQGLMKLLAYDEKHDTDYISTLRCYILCKFNISEAAEKSFVHRSTFIRKLERIKAIANIDFTEMADLDELLHILVSYRIIN